MCVCVCVSACTGLLFPFPPPPNREKYSSFDLLRHTEREAQRTASTSVQSSLSSHTSNIHHSPRKHLQENETQDFLPSPHLLPPRRDLLGRASRWPQLQLENSSPAKIQEDERHQEGLEGRRQELGQIDPELAGGTKLPKDLNCATNEKSGK